MDEDKKNLHRVKFLDYKLQNGVTYYSISVTTYTNSESWIFESRYRQMLELHEQILSTFSIKLPSFPPKKWPGNLNADFISQRQKSLENYFNNLLKVVNLEKVPILKNFLYQSYKKKEEKPKTLAIPTLPNPLPQKTIVKEAIKEDKPNFEKVIENLKYVDLTTNLESPEEEEVKEKREKYRVFVFNLKLKFPKKFALPEMKNSKILENLANNANFAENTEITKPSLARKNLGFFTALNECMESLIKELDHTEHLVIKSQLVYCFQSWIIHN